MTKGESSSKELDSGIHAPRFTLPGPRVYLVGAGPGDPGLLTLRAVECLSRADLVLYDRLVPASLLDFAAAGARRVCVNDLAGHHRERIPLIHQTMIEAAGQGQCVVRLKGGDPFVFGRGGEEAAALHEAGIAYEIVPGVTAALGAAACAGIPLTHRDHASAVAFVTGHEQPDKTESALDFAALARFPGTLVFYMGMSRLPQVVQALIAHGMDRATPAAAIAQATTAAQRTVTAPLHNLPRAVEEAGIRPPALVIVGSVVTFRDQLAWFEARPLFGKRVVVTRPRHQAGPLARRLEELGAQVLLLPAVEVREPADWAPVDRALEQLNHFDWLVFTSVNGVNYFLQHLRQTGRDLRALGTLRLAAIGPATADALRGYHLEPDLVPPEFRSESLAEALRERVAGKRVLLARADRGRELLREELARVADVEQVAVYSQVDALPEGAEGLEQLRRGAVDFVTLTSSNVARALLGSLDLEGRTRILEGQTRLVSISPVTSAAVRELGFPVAAEASEYVTDGVVKALLKLARQTD
jgi:uroporphyrinogen III methyltransferase/synthase